MSPPSCSARPRSNRSFSTYVVVLISCCETGLGRMLLVAFESALVVQEFGGARADALTPTTAATASATCIVTSRFVVVVRLWFRCCAVRITWSGGSVQTFGTAGISGPLVSSMWLLERHVSRFIYFPSAVSAASVAPSRRVSPGSRSPRSLASAA